MQAKAFSTKYLSRTSSDNETLDAVPGINPNAITDCFHLRSPQNFSWAYQEAWVEILRSLTICLVHSLTLRVYRRYFYRKIWIDLESVLASFGCSAADLTTRGPTLDAATSRAREWTESESYHWRHSKMVVSTVEFQEGKLCSQWKNSWLLLFHLMYRRP